MSNFTVCNKFAEIHKSFSQNDLFKQTIELIDNFLEQTDNDHNLWYSNYLKKNALTNNIIRLQKTKDFQQIILQLMQYSFSLNYNATMAIVDYECNILMQINDVLLFFINPTN
jgi:hypothetical protein